MAAATEYPIQDEAGGGDAAPIVQDFWSDTPYRQAPREDHRVQFSPVSPKHSAREHDADERVAIQRAPFTGACLPLLHVLFRGGDRRLTRPSLLPQSPR